jgi:hypothetical protein
LKYFITWRNHISGFPESQNTSKVGTGTEIGRPRRCLRNPSTISVPVPNLRTPHTPLWNTLTAGSVLPDSGNPCTVSLLRGAYDA